MHFITGGAFNGKRAWVKQRYKIESQSCWLSAYQGDHILIDVNRILDDLLVLEGLELWIKELLRKYDTKQSIEILQSWLDQWGKWESSQANRQLVIIGTDITKGIVPIEKEDRTWRDVTGWTYQKLAGRANNVDIIWYGINQTIK